MVRLAETLFRESIGIVGMNVPAMPVFCIAAAGIANFRTSSAVGFRTFLCKPASSRYCAQSHGIPNRVLAGVWTLIFHLPPFRRAHFPKRRRIISRVSSMDGGCMLCSFFPAVFLQCFPRQNSRSLHLRLSKPPIDHQAVLSLSSPRRITRFVSQFPLRESIAPAKPGIMPP